MTTRSAWGRFLPRRGRHGACYDADGDHHQGVQKRGHDHTIHADEPGGAGLALGFAPATRGPLPHRMPRPRPGDGGALYEVAGVGGRLFFTRDATRDGPRELWATDGTTNGTRRLAERFADNLTDVDGTLFFSTVENDANVLWKSDGTPEGTVHVAEITSTVDGLYGPTRFAAVGRQLFFFADDGTRTFTLQASDGVASRTARLAAVTPSVAGQSI